MIEALLTNSNLAQRQFLPFGKATIAGHTPQVKACNGPKLINGIDNSSSRRKNQLERGDRRLSGAHPKKTSKIQQRNRSLILEAALDVFSQHGYRGATLDQIAEAAGLSKPNILYYFDGKEEIHITLLNQLMETWLDPLVTLDADGDPLTEILNYVQRKLDMAHELPRESRLFAGEILQGAPRMAPHLQAGLQPLFDEKCAVIQRWMDAGHLTPVDPRHLIFSIWATTQHYADFAAQVKVLLRDEPATQDDAQTYLTTLFTKLLSR